MKNIQPHIILGKLLKNKLSSDDYGLYHYGNVNEIKTVMRESSVKTKLYPLIWCELPLTNPVQSPVGLTANLKVFLATPSRKEWLNDERQIETFEKVLNPLYDKFCDILKKSDSFQVIDRQINRNDLPNFYTSEIGTRDNKEKNQVEEYWDVVTLDFRAIVMGGKCEVDLIAPVNTDITLDFDYEDLGNNEYRLFWSTENAYRVYLNSEIVSNIGEKVVTVNDISTFTLFAYNKDYKTAFDTIVIDQQVSIIHPILQRVINAAIFRGYNVPTGVLLDNLNTYCYENEDYLLTRGHIYFTQYNDLSLEDFARIDWATLNEMQVFGGVTYTLDGFKMGGVNGYINTKFEPSESAFFDKDNFDISSVILEDFSTSVGFVTGIQNSSPTRRLGFFPRHSANTSLYFSNDLEVSNYLLPWVGNSDLRFINIGRFNTNSKYINLKNSGDENFEQRSVSSLDMINGEYYIGALNNNGSVIAYCDGTFCFNAIGTSLTKAQIDRNNQAYQNYLNRL